MNYHQLIFQDHFQLILCIYSLKISLHKCLSCGLLIFFKDDNLNITPFNISKSSWDLIGSLMQNNKKNMPLEFGRPPRNIFKHNAGYKAEEWANWITLYSVPLIKNYLPET